MNYLQTIIICTLCFLNLQIFVAPDGECIEIRTNDGASFPCTDYIKQDTGCFDEKGNTQLCGASWEQVEEG